MTASSAVIPQTGALQPAAASGWRRGYANLLHHENHVRWANRRWLVQSVVWLAIINGFVALIAVASRLDPSGAAGDPYAILIQVFFTMGMLAAGIGVIIASQSAIVGEKQLGTAAWILSKPVSRPAFVLAKLVATALAFLVFAIILPALVFYAESLLAARQAPFLLPFAAATALLALHTLFYLTLTLLLGTLFEERGPVLAIALGTLFAGLILPNFLPQIAVPFPWKLSDTASALALSQPLPPLAAVSIAACLLWVVLFMGLAIRRFAHMEF